MTVVLTKGKSHKVDLGKSGFQSNAMVRIHLGWEHMPQAYDLDLDAFCKGKNGEKLVVQALGEHFGSHHIFPFLRLHGDNRVGGSNGEIITGNLGQIMRHLEWFGIGLINYRSRMPLSRVEGAVTTVTLPGHEPIVVNHDQQDTSVCSVLQVHVEPGGLRVQHDLRALRYGVFPWRPASPELALDRHWGFGANWTSGQKS